MAAALTIFLSAFLLFEIEPVLGKYVLPWFGGAPAVWTTCLLFFQTALLAGYLYAHGLMRSRPAVQRAVHLTLLAVSVVLLFVLAHAWGSPILPGPSWKPADASRPVGRILGLLAVAIGLPYFLLSSTSPLLQAWTARARPRRGRGVYRLYALSNAGSLLAPLTYPFLVEPALRLRTQAAAWSWGYGAFAAGAAFCAWRAGTAAARLPPAVPEPAASESPAESSRLLPLLWFSLAACGSLMLLAATNQISQEVAAIPFLWLLPLSLYLLSFILCFESDRLYSRGFYGALLVLALGWSALVLFQGFVVPARTQVTAHSLALFAACMVLHGELARSRPDPRRLTSFYLTIAAGGAAGGLFVALAAPRLFGGFWELHVGLWLSGALALAALIRDRRSWIWTGSSLPAIGVLLAAGALANRIHDTEFFSNIARLWSEKLATIGHRALFAAALTAVGVIAWLFRRRLALRSRPVLAVACLAGALGLLGYALLADVKEFERSVVRASRNFYGVLTIEQIDPDDPAEYRLSLRHGRIVHGSQYQSAEKRRFPTTYYGIESGIGRALLHHPRRDRGPLTVGVVGLGVGTIAAYGRPGDRYRFYDINPGVVRLSAGPRSLFTFLRDCPCRTEVVLGDARLSLERELSRGERQNFDVLAVDAFSSDSIPVHLLTREAAGIYTAHLRSPDGILALHISNRHLDLAPVVRGLADALRLPATVVDTEGGDDEAVWGATWVLLSRDRAALAVPGIADAASALSSSVRVPLWTDDYSNLFRVLK